MKRKKGVVIIAVLLCMFAYSHSYITVTVMSILQHREAVTVPYDVNTEPKARLAEIVSLVLDSMVSPESGDIKYLAIDAKQVEGISDKDVQYLLTYFKKYNDKVIYASMKDLKKLGLYSPFGGKHLNNGLLLSVNKVEELTNDRAVIKASYFYSGMGAAGYRFVLIYKDGKWQKESSDMLYIA